MSIVVFSLSRQFYGLYVEEVREIAPIARLTPLAGAPAYLLGLLTLRGRYVPVIDGRALVGAPAQFSLENQIVIVGSDQPEFGLLVDEVHDVRAPEGEPTALGEESAAPFLAALVPNGEAPLLLLDRAAILALIPSFAHSREMEALVD